MVVRSWNLFHGNAVPPERHAYLREMVELVTADDPDVVCLQEVPVWALGRLEGWSGMRAVGGVGAEPLLRSAELGRLVTDLHHGILRSAVTGEALAVLVARRHAVVDERRERVGPNRVLVGVRLEGGPFVGNFHVTGGAVAQEQFRRVVELVPDGAVVLAGDVNLRPPYALEGFSDPLAGSIDQILVRGLPATAPVAWPAERRRVHGKLLSDHAPVELIVG
ncbi:MAG TPA: endonuclease/exonuclease/phosphatase family protein [Gaiellaceae bacterium]|nr:endonuclease/exonuclease/phosphatase family protein [Gaiellaceae bacterium]